jgi:hypothetical protein
MIFVRRKICVARRVLPPTAGGDIGIRSAHACRQGLSRPQSSPPLSRLDHRSGTRVTKPIRREMRRRAAVEPVIGHLKADHRMDRNYLKGREGDRANAAAGYNFAFSCAGSRSFCAPCFCSSSGASIAYPVTAPLDSAVKPPAKQAELGLNQRRSSRTTMQCRRCHHLDDFSDRLYARRGDAGSAETSVNSHSRGDVISA